MRPDGQMRRMTANVFLQKSRHAGRCRTIDWSLLADDADAAGKPPTLTSQLGIIHDLTVGASPMVDEGIGGAKIRVTARYENKRLNLYLNGKRLVVTRYRKGEEMVWRWGPYVNRLRRLTGPQAN